MPLSRVLSAAFLLASPLAWAQASFGNSLRLGPDVHPQALCTACSDAEVYQGLAIQFVPTADQCPASGGCLKSVFLHTGPNSSTDAGESAVVRVAIQQAPLASGAELASVAGVLAPPDTWIQADFVANGSPAGAVALSVGSTYFLVVTATSTIRPSIDTVGGGSTAPVGATRGVDARTGGDLSMAALLRPGGVWQSEPLTDAPVFVTTTTLPDPWAPVACGGPNDLPFGNPYLSLEDVQGNASTVPGEAFVHLGEAACATAVTVQIASSGGAIVATLSGGTGSATASLAPTGSNVDGYGVYSGAFTTALPLVQGTSYLLSLSGTTFSARAYSTTPPDSTGCSPRTRATWRGAPSSESVSGAPNPNADLWFTIDTVPTCPALGDAGTAGDGGASDGGTTRSWYACSCSGGSEAALVALAAPWLLLRRKRLRSNR